MGPLEAYVNAGFPAVLAVIFSLGLVSGFSPCGLPTVALVVGYVSRNGTHGRANGFLVALSFVLGIATVLTLLGGLSGFLGGLLVHGQAVFAKGSMGLKIFLAGASGIFILLGLWMLKIINFHGFNLMGRMQVEKGSGAFGAFLLGLPFGIAASPCTLPVTIAVLLYLAARGEALSGMLFMFVFTLGRSIPILVAGTFTGLLAKLDGFARWQLALEKLGGSIMVLLGAHFILRSVLNINYLKLFS